MENLKIEKGQRTPGVDFNNNGELRIEGRSTPENALEFYEVLIKWIKDYELTKPSNLNLHIKLEFFNTSSGKLLINIFKQIENFRSDGVKPNIYWHYDEIDEDMLQAGQDYQSILRVPLHFIKN
jgi:hypothetical protein